MAHISLTDFVDVVAASGTPKATKVRHIKNRPDYSPASDFYKRIRKTIVEAHEEAHPKAFLETALRGLTDPKKVTAYPVIVAAYKKWWGRKTIGWIGSANQIYSNNGVEISVNPEMGVEINGVPHYVKLYFKTDRLSKDKGTIITHLMATALSEDCPAGTMMSVLDIRRSKLISLSETIPELSAIVDAELAYMAALWPTL